MMGDELPAPETATCHRTLSLGDHLSGYVPDSTSPCPLGPRQRVQYLPRSPSGGTMRTFMSTSPRTAVPADGNAAFFFSFTGGTFEKSKSTGAGFSLLNGCVSP